MNLKDKKLFLLDMDGTIYLGNKIFPFTIPFLEAIKKNGGRCMYLTNNTSRGVCDYIKKLNGMGISATEEDFMTATEATLKYLKAKNYSLIFVMGTKSFVNALKQGGLNVTEELKDGIDCFCMGFDTELTFKKLDDACKLLSLTNVDYVASHPDMTCPTEYGFVPDCGSIAQIIYNATRKKPKVIGKPEPTMIELALEKTGFKKEQAVMFGDRLKTDILSGLNAGIDSILVLTGEDNEQKINEYNITPTAVYQSLEKVTEELNK